MWLPQNIIQQVDEVARIYYLDVAATRRWNERRSADELRMLTGWCWIARHGEQHGQGLKTITVAYREAYYNLVAKTAAPTIKRPLKLVGRAA